MDPASIKSLSVFPPLGIARIGNAPEPGDFIIGPEVIGSCPTTPDDAPARFLPDFRMTDGRIKRQAARFRIYAHFEDGSVAEVTSDHATIEWRVAVANLKAGWYEFNQAMDLPPGKSENAKRRNVGFSIPGGRASLDITPSPLTIAGTSQPAVYFDDGLFWRTPVRLGELRTDDKGRLLFLSGLGVSAAFLERLAPITYANNVGWHDDIADGPVRARVTFPGREPIEAEAGYVAVTPPNYAPGLQGVVTMDDVVRETFQDRGWVARPSSTSFTRDIWPIFDRLTGLQWVNHGSFILHGRGSPLDARSAEVVARMRNAGAEKASWRASVFALFRDPERDGALVPPQLPQAYGDAVDDLWTPAASAWALLSVTRTQFAHLKRWAAGKFDDDWPGEPPTPPKFEELSPAEQVSHLERASLHDCLGGPFHPSIEITWVMRLPLLWSRAYRLNVSPTDDPARQDYGDTLTPQVCVGRGGPFDGVAAGALTRFMGVPWQTDEASCNSAAEYTPTTFLSVPTFWGARAPDQVLSWESYVRASHLAGEPATAIQAQKHFNLRSDWLRDVRGQNYYDRIGAMVTDWWELGMVLPPSDAPTHLPPDTRVEQGRADRAAGTDYKPALVEAIEKLFDTPEGGGAEMFAIDLEPVAPERPHVPPKRVYRQGEI